MKRRLAVVLVLAAVVAGLLYAQKAGRPGHDARPTPPASARTVRIDELRSALLFGPAQRLDADHRAVDAARARERFRLAWQHGTTTMAVSRT